MYLEQGGGGCWAGGC